MGGFRRECQSINYDSRRTWEVGSDAGSIPASSIYADTGQTFETGIRIFLLITCRKIMLEKSALKYTQKILAFLL